MLCSQVCLSVSEVPRKLYKAPSFWPKTVRSQWIMEAKTHSPGTFSGLPKEERICVQDLN